MGFILCYLYNLISEKFLLNYFPMKTCLINKPFSIDALVHCYFSHYVQNNIVVVVIVLKICLINYWIVTSWYFDVILIGFIDNV